MAAEDATRQELLERIKTRRAESLSSARKLEKRGNRLTNLSIICSALTTALTAGPAVGGESFTERMQGVFQLHSDSTVWRLLCFGAVLLSIVAAVSNTLHKSHDLATRLSKAQASNAALESLETALALQQISLEDAVKQFQQHIRDYPAMDRA